jgi:hypothetical protein
VLLSYSFRVVGPWNKCAIRETKNFLSVMTSKTRCESYL